MGRYTNTFSRYRWLLVFILLATPSLVALLIQPKSIFTVQATIWVEQPISQENRQNLSADGYDTAAANQATLLKELLKTATYLKQVSAKVKEAGFNLDPTQEEALQVVINQGFKVTTQGDHTIVLEYKDLDARLTLTTVNSVIQSFVELVTDRFRSQGSIAISRMEAQLSDIQTKIEQNNEKFNKYIADHPEITRSANDDLANSAFPTVESLEYAHLQQDLQSSREEFNSLGTRLEQLKISYGAFISGRDSIIHLLDAPHISDSIVYNPVRRLMLGLVAGLVAGILLVAMLVLVFTWSDRSFRQKQHLKEVLGLGLTLELAYSRAAIRPARPLPPKKTRLHISYYHSRNRLKALIGGFLALLLVGGIGRLVSLNLSLGIALLFSCLVLLLISRWPVVGVLLTVLIVIPCELFSTPEGISQYTILPLTNLNFYTPLPLSATPIEIVLAYTAFCTITHRLLRQQKLFELNLTNLGMAIFAGFLIFAYIYGVYIKHGDPKAAQWEIRAQCYIPILYFLTINLMRNRSLWRVYSWLIPIGVTLAGIITVVRFFVLLELPGKEGDLYRDSLNGFNHETVLMYVILIMWCLSKIMFGGNLAEKLVSFFLLSPALLCMLISNRRVAFATLAACIIVLLGVMFIKYRKFFIVSVIILAIIVPPYMVIFRNASGPLGAAARAFNSSSAQPGSRDYNSDLFRLIEKTNVQMTIKTTPYLGIGFGQQYIRFIDAIDLNGFVWQNYTSHVQVLWLWLKVGMFGWGLFWFIICLSMFKLGQLTKHWKSDNDFTTVFIAGCTIATIMVHSYVDLGLINTRLMSLIGISIGLLELGYRSWLNSNKMTAKPLVMPSQPDRELAASH